MTGAREVGAAEARALVESGAAKLIDVREQHEWDRGHAPEAALEPMSLISSRVDALPTDAPLLIVCHSGVRSARVASALRAAGLDATSVTGGMVEWHATGGEIIAEGDQPPTVD